MLRWHMQQPPRISKNSKLIHAVIYCMNDSCGLTVTWCYLNRSVWVKNNFSISMAKLQISAAWKFPFKVMCCCVFWRQYSPATQVEWKLSQHTAPIKNPGNKQQHNLFFQKDTLSLKNSTIPNISNYFNGKVLDMESCYFLFWQSVVSTRFFTLTSWMCGAFWCIR